MALWLFIGVALLMLVVGWLAGRKQGDEDYNIYGRKLPKWLYSASYAASYMGAGFLIVTTAYVYKYGLGLMWFIGGYFIGFFIFGFFSGWLKNRHEGKKLYTLPGYFMRRFGKKSAGILIILQMLLIAGDLAIQLISGGKLLAELGIAPFLASVLLTIVIIGIYLFVSGFRAVVWTDMVLLAGIFVMILVLAFNAGSMLISTDNVAPEPEPFPLALIIGAFIFGIILPFGNTTYYQRIFAAKDEESARHGTWISMLWVLVPTIAITIVGITARTLIPNIDPDTAFFAVLGLGGHVMLYLGALLLWACLMSSADTLAFAGSQVFTKDVLKKKLTVKSTRLGLFVVLAAGLLVTFLVPSLLDLTVLFFGGGINIGLPAFLNWFFKFSDRAVASAMTISSIGMVIYAVLTQFNPIAVFVALVLSLGVLIVVSGGEKIIRWRRSHFRH